MPTAVTPPEAIIYAMVTAAAADRMISAEEIQRMGSAVRELPAFQRFTQDWFAETAQQCGMLLRKPSGVELVLATINDSLPTPLRETAYLLAAEITKSDLATHTDEDLFLAQLANALGLDKLVTASLERAASARNQRA